jgi:hypothetical protein
LTAHPAHGGSHTAHARDVCTVYDTVHTHDTTPVTTRPDTTTARCDVRVYTAASLSVSLSMSLSPLGLVSVAEHTNTRRHIWRPPRTARRIQPQLPRLPSHTLTTRSHVVSTPFYTLFCELHADAAAPSVLRSIAKASAYSNVRFSASASQGGLRCVCGAGPSSQSLIRD